MAKAGPTATNAAAFAVIDGEEGQTFTELGFDVRNDGACGAGAPRLNVQASDGFHFCGCSGATSAPIAGTNWTRKRFLGPECFPAITVGATLQSVDVVFDEGTDTPVPNAGSTYIDNIDINGTLIGKPGNAK
jgi:hypothetical protein